MNYTYKAKLVRCVDGDTMDVDVDLGFHLTARIRCRLLGVNTPERGRPDFARATLMLENLLQSQADEEGFFVMRTGKTGKFGRWLAEVNGVNSVLKERWPYEN
mgnify:CR=1 FL=1|jgi:micrococcal nuclease|tara:strand:- start:5127 stop:5435 length:309 start_codon:yes stop_codon:yes gene_type:complete